LAARSAHCLAHFSKSNSATSLTLLYVAAALRRCGFDLCFTDAPLRT
jgi:hypothetical protein